MRRRKRSHRLAEIGAVLSVLCAEFGSGEVLRCGVCPALDSVTKSCVFPPRANASKTVYELVCDEESGGACIYGTSTNVTSILVPSGVSVTLEATCTSLVWDLVGGGGNGTEKALEGRNGRNEAGSMEDARRRWRSEEASSIVIEGNASVHAAQVYLGAGQVIVHDTGVINATARGRRDGASEGYGGSSAGSGGHVLGEDACDATVYVADAGAMGEYYSVDPGVTYRHTGRCAVAKGSREAAAGGCILVVADTAAINGVLEARGAGAADDSGSGGGGGGSIGISVTSLTIPVTACILADGGRGPAGGGGGRVALSYNASDPAASLGGVLTASGGAGSSACARGGAGTLFLEDISSATAPSVEVLPPAHRTKAGTLVDSEKDDTSFDALTVSGGATLLAQTLSLVKLVARANATLVGYSLGTPDGTLGDFSVAARDASLEAQTAFWADGLSLLPGDAGTSAWTWHEGSRIMAMRELSLSAAEASLHLAVLVNAGLEGADLGSVYPAAENSSVSLSNRDGDIIIDAAARIFAGRLRIHSAGDTEIAGALRTYATLCSTNFARSACNTSATTAASITVLEASASNASLALLAEASLTVAEAATLEGGSVYLGAAGSMVIEARAVVSAAGRGWAPGLGPGRGDGASRSGEAGGGGGYGGSGGYGLGFDGAYVPGGLSYGSDADVASCGSSGGGGWGTDGVSLGGAGGGKVLVCGLAGITVKGNVTSDGQVGQPLGGGGSGGAVAIVTTRMSGTEGALTARGGEGGASEAGGSATGGGGGGGRLFVVVGEGGGATEGPAVEYTPEEVSVAGAGGNSLAATDASLIRGEDGTLRFPDCPEGYGNELKEPYGFCEVCDEGTFSAARDPGACVVCSNAPKHSSYTASGSTTATCAYECDIGYSPPHCKKPLDSLLDRLGGWVGLVLIIVGALVLFLGAVVLWRRYLKQRRRRWGHVRRHSLDEGNVFHHIFAPTSLRAEGDEDGTKPDPSMGLLGGFGGALQQSAWQKRSRSSAGDDAAHQEPLLASRRSEPLSWPQAAWAAVFGRDGSDPPANYEDTGRADSTPSRTHSAAVPDGLPFSVAVAELGKQSLRYRMSRKDLPWHAGRIFLGGRNTPANPWVLNPALPEGLRPIFHEREWRALAERINAMTPWSCFEEAMLRLLQLLCNPLYQVSLEHRRLARGRKLKRLVACYDQEAFRGGQAQLEQCLRVTVSVDCTTACIDVLHKEGAESVFQPLTAVGQPTTPAVFRFAGLGTYASPLHVDTRDVLVKAVPHIPSLAAFISASWVRFLDELNDELRSVRWPTLRRDLNRVEAVVARWNAQSGEALGGLVVELVIVDSASFDLRDEARGLDGRLPSLRLADVSLGRKDLLSRLGIAVDVDPRNNGMSGGLLRSMAAGDSDEEAKGEAAAAGDDAASADTSPAPASDAEPDREGEARAGKGERAAGGAAGGMPPQTKSAEDFDRYSRLIQSLDSDDVAPRAPPAPATPDRLHLSRIPSESHLRVDGPATPIAAPKAMLDSQIWEAQSPMGPAARARGSMSIKSSGAALKSSDLAMGSDEEMDGAGGAPGLLYLVGGEFEDLRDVAPEERSSIRSSLCLHEGGYLQSSAMLHPCRRLVVRSDPAPPSPASRASSRSSGGDAGDSTTWGCVLCLVRTADALRWLLLPQHRRVSLGKGFMRPLRLAAFLMVVYDIVAVIILLVSLWCVGSSRGDEDCSHKAVYIHVALYPMAGLVAPLACLAAVALEFGFVFQQAVLWNALSVINAVVACGLVHVYPQEGYVVVMAYAALLNKVLLNLVLTTYGTLDARYRRKFQRE